MFKYFGKYRRYGDTAIVGDVAQATLLVLDNRNHVSESELPRNERVREHVVHEGGQPIKKVDWRKMEVFSIDTVFITAFSVFHGTSCLDEIFKSDLVFVAITIISVDFLKLVVSSREFSIQVINFPRVIWLRILLEAVSEGFSNGFFAGAAFHHRSKFGFVPVV